VLGSRKSLDAAHPRHAWSPIVNFAEVSQSCAAVFRDDSVVQAAERRLVNPALELV